MQRDILGPFASSPYKYVLTAIDVLTKYLFATPLTTLSALSVATTLVSSMFQHSYIPQERLSDSGTQFVSELFRELNQLLEIKKSHASLNHAQTISVVEKAHAALTWILKLNSNQNFTNWHKYINLTTFIHNTPYHTSIGCASAVIFLRRYPVKPSDARFNSTCIQKSAFNYGFVESLRDEMLKIFQNTKESLAKTFNRYRGYYDQKARANPLTEQPKLIQKWLALYRVERVLTDFNYLIRKIGTTYTQIVHRIRLRPIKPHYQLTDIEDINSDNFQTDPTLGCYRGDQDFFDNGLPSLLDNDQVAPEKNSEFGQPSLSLNLLWSTIATTTTSTNSQSTWRRNCDSRTVNNSPSS